jgi:hypothetical protein
MGVLIQNKGKLCKISIKTLFFEKDANFFAENWRKSQKIVIITSTPGADSTIAEFTLTTVSSLCDKCLSGLKSKKENSWLCKHTTLFLCCI